jgi:hypothetical protein
MQCYNYDYQCLSSIDGQSSGIEAAITDHVSTPNEKNNHPKGFKVTTIHDSQLPLLMITIAT